MKRIKNEELQLEEETLERRLINKSTTSDSSAREDEVRTRSSLMEHDPNKEKEVRKAKNAGKTFKRLFGYTWRNRPLLLVANLSLLVSSGCMVLLPMMCGQMVDSIRERGDLVAGSIRFILLTVVMAVFSAARGFTFNMLGEKIQVSMRQELFDRIIEKDISYYDRTKTGELLSRLGNDIATVYSVCSDNLSMLIRNLLQFIGSLAFLWVISWKLTTFIIVLTPIISFVILLVIKIIKKYQKEYSNNLAFATSLATEVFGNIRVVRSFANEAT
jgi:ABC-type multidrug transport system fused ATPase/permease subunit